MSKFPSPQNKVLGPLVNPTLAVMYSASLWLGYTAKD
ncbi:hypothetical protein SLEP1_g48524 [Rubroshorea leprosula]|uniref:Uncharacterized protein n=1 Tax=Rubroshorea leprosula TaxID=152421 RepID=A0AAV5LWW6_9ROSI|nr:hypothetical protein SLEP1_g48524 [Rubroshorea leprosula]